MPLPREPHVSPDLPCSSQDSHFTVEQKGYTQKTNEEKVNVFQTPYLH